MTYSATCQMADCAGPLNDAHVAEQSRLRR